MASEVELHSKLCRRFALVFTNGGDALLSGILPHQKCENRNFSILDSALSYPNSLIVESFSGTIIDTFVAILKYN